MLPFIENKQFKNMKTRIEEDLTLKFASSNDILAVKIVISYICRQTQVEFDSYRNFISKFESETIESLCYKIYQEFKNYVRKLYVCVIGKTANHPLYQVELSENIK